MASSSKSASTSASTSTADDNTYYAFDVFLNHRGSDGYRIASHLYYSLTDHGLRVFLDKEEMEKGEELTAQIEGAIRASSVNIAIFTPQYCQSHWCLKELVLMLECKRAKETKETEETEKTKGSTILPIFFHVDPSVPRWAKGVYGKDLSLLQKEKNSDFQPRYDLEIIRKWKSALRKVAGMSGFVLEGDKSYNGDESKLLKDVVEKVLKLVPKPPPNICKYPTGLKEKVKDFEDKIKDFKERLHQHESGKAEVVGIVGRGGIGKTTLAKELFKLKKEEYGRSSFLFRVREKDSSGKLDKLQRQLIKDLTGGKDVEIDSPEHGTSLLKRHLPRWHAFIILDDVHDVGQLDALLPVLPKKGSLILVTSRNKTVLKKWGLIEDPFIYTLEGLSRQHSVELFCQHAFHRPGPPDAVFEHLVNKFVDACGKLPLCLCVIGALLYDEKNPKHWKEELRKISKTLPAKIQEILEISYQSLDNQEKKLFLDVACNFVGQEKDTAMMIWEDSGWAASRGLESLRNKHLVQVEVDAVWKDEVQYSGGQLQKYYRECMVEYITMHDELRVMGRSLARRKTSLRRIWRVTENLSDLSSVKRGRVSAKRDRRVRDHRGSSRVEGLFNVKQRPQLILLRCYNCPDSSFPPNISTKNLKVLHIEGSNLETLWHRESQAPRQLRELYIAGSRLPEIPQSIEQLQSLEKVVLRCEKDIVSFKTLPEGFCQLQSLKHLELHEKCLKSLPPSFWDLRSLQHLNLAGCTCLKKLPESCPNPTKLQHIDLSSCMKLRKLPDSFGNLTNLQHVNLSDCTKLRGLPDSFGNLTNLQHIDLSDCKELETLPNTFGNLIQLKFLSLSGCHWLTVPSEALGNITTLEHLNLAECFAELPRQLTSQQFLQELYLTSSKLPKAIGNLSNLKILSVEGYELEKLPSSFRALRSLEELEFEGCPFKCFPDSIRKLTQLKKLALRSMDLKQLKITEWFSGLPTTLETLEIRGCEEMEELSGLERLESLKDLQISSCDGLKRIHGLAQLTKLQTLDVQMNDDLEELPGIEGSQSLKKVNASICPKLKKKTRRKLKKFTEYVF